MKGRFFLYIIIPVILLLATTCSMTRDHMYGIVSTPTIPDIEVVDLPNQVGSYSFGTIEVYTASTADFNIKNRGTGNLVIKGISFVEEDVTWFTIDKSSLKSVVRPGCSTTFKIRFKPTAASSQTRTVIILSNVADKSPYTFSIEGIGCGAPTFLPDINVKQGTDDIPDGALVLFGEIEVDSSSSKVFTIENVGEGDLGVFDVSITPDGGTMDGEFIALAPSIPASLAEGDKVPFTLEFSPNNEGSKSATVNISNDDPGENPYTITVEGYGSPAPAPDINIKQGSTDIPINTGVYDFGFIECDTTSLPVEFTIENTGTANLTITNVSPTDGLAGQFSIDPTGMEVTLTPGSSTNFEITFSPNSTEEYKWAIVTVENTDPDESEYDFYIEGWGVIDPVPDLIVTNTPYDSYFDFGPVLLAPLTPKTVPFTIANKGTGNLTIFDVINKNPGVFDLDDSMTATSIPPSGNTTFEVTFTPEDTSKEKATIKIESDDPDTETYKFTVVAHGSYGTEPDINVKHDGVYFPNDGTFYFPDTPVGSSSAPVSFIIENSGTGTLLLDSILFTGSIVSYEIDYDNTNLTVPPESELPITIWFIPEEAKKYAAKLEIESNDPDEEKYIIKIKGHGI
jgi:hypothetical protein